MSLAGQRTFADLGAPLADVPFCVLDIETTGGPPSRMGITEVAAQRYRGGDLEGEFATLVNPGTTIPPFITILTGITHAMVVEAPRVPEMLPALLEFIGDAVVVGHNIRYDLGFINAAAEHHGYGQLRNRSVDTLALARRLVGSDTRNLKLATLAAHFRSPVSPTHRALDDTRATAHVFWELLEQAGSIGVTHLDDLLRLPTARGRPNYRKIGLTEALPRRPGVYLFRDRDGTVFYVGKAKCLRTRVRGYFYGDTRRSVARMLNELDTIEHRVCAGDLEASIAEIRLIAAHLPRHNRRSKPTRAPHWVKLTKEQFPRLSLVRSAREGGLALIGPFRGRNAARAVVEALWDAVPIRRCTGPAGARAARCAFAQLDVAACPCDGTLGEASYARIVARLLDGLNSRPELLLDPLRDRVAAQARALRFEEAGWTRDRHAALARAIARRHAWKALQAAGTIHAAGDEGGALIERGRLVAAWRDGARPPLHSMAPSPGTPGETPETLADADEADLVWRWLQRDDVTVVDTSAVCRLDPLPIPALERVAV